MDKMLIAGLLTIAGVITSLLLFDGIRESVDITAATNQQTQLQSGVDAQTKLEIITAQDENNGRILDIWIKNTGIVGIEPITIPDLELFLINMAGTWGEYINYSPSGPVAGADTWSEVAFADPIWAPGKTLRIRATLGANPILATSYRMSITTSNNITAEYSFRGNPQ